MFESPALDPNARRDAWDRVLDVVADAIDTPGLAPASRAALAEIYEFASEWAGKPKVVVPQDLVYRGPAPVRPIGRPEPEPTQDCEPDDLWQLYAGVPRGERITPDTYRALYNAGVRRVTEIADLDRRELRSIPRIGPKRADEILGALAAYAKQQARADARGKGNGGR